MKHVILQQWRFVQRGNFKPTRDRFTTNLVFRGGAVEMEAFMKGSRRGQENANRSAPTGKYSIDKIKGENAYILTY